MRFYTYDPGGVGQDAFKGSYVAGQTFLRVDTGTPVVCQGVAVPEWGLYEATEDNSTCPEYYQPPTVNKAFSGAVGSAAARVVETVVCTRISLDDLYQRKLEEIGREDRRVRYNAVDTALSANWWLLVTESAQSELTIIGIGANQREIRSQAWPSGVNAPWVGIYNEVSERIRRYQITSAATWDTLLLEWNGHAQATGNATEASRASLEADYNAAETALSNAGGDEDDPAYQAAWDVVAAHDAADPAWGYPPTINFNDAASTLFGG